MADWKPDRTVTVPVPDKKVGLDKSSKVHLWVVPAQVAGLWCGEGLLRDASLELAQRYQEFERHAEAPRAQPAGGGPHRRQHLARAGRARPANWCSQVQGGQLRILAAGGPLALAQGMGFHRAAGGRCG